MYSLRTTGYAGFYTSDELEEGIGNHMTQEQRIKHNAAVKAEWERNGKRQRIIAFGTTGSWMDVKYPHWEDVLEYYIHPADDSYAVQMVKAIERGEEMQGRVRSTGIWIPHNDPKEVLVSSLNPEVIRIKPKTKKVKVTTTYFIDKLNPYRVMCSTEYDKIGGDLQVIGIKTETFEVPV